jgi:hypothetical protein
MEYHLNAVYSTVRDALGDKQASQGLDGEDCVGSDQLSARHCRTTQQTYMEIYWKHF